MKQSMVLLVAMLMGGVAPAFAENLSCTAGDYFTIQGELQDGIFTAQTTVVLAGANVIDVQNLKYKKSDKPGLHFQLIADDASRSAAPNDRHLVPGMLDLTIGTPSLVYFSLPSKDDKGQLRPVLIRTMMTCEKASSAPKAAPQYSLY